MCFYFHFGWAKLEYVKRQNNWLERASMIAHCINQSNIWQALWINKRFLIKPTFFCVFLFLIKNLMAPQEPFLFYRIQEIDLRDIKKLKREALLLILQEEFILTCGNFNLVMIDKCLRVMETKKWPCFSLFQSNNIIPYVQKRLKKNTAIFLLRRL